MLKRLFIHDRLFSTLLVILFTSVFLIMFYGLDIYFQFSNIEANIERIKYAEQYDYGIRFDSDMFMEKGRVPFGRGNIIYRTFFPIGDSALYHDNVDIMWEQNEPVLETINYKYGFDSLKGTELHLCVLGDKWRKKVSVRGDDEFIDILGIEFKVIGYFEPILLDNSDERCLIVGDSVSLDELNRLAKFEDGQFVYKSVTYVGVMEDFENWIHNYSLEENTNLMMPTDMVMDSNIYIARLYEGYAKKIFGALSIFCVINTFYLSYVWGKKKQKTLMIKKVFGYNNRYLAKDMLEEIAVLELISLGVAGVVTFFYEIFFRSLSEWVSILAKGMLIAVIVIVSITVIYLLSQIVWVLRSQPVDVLRNSE